MNLIEYSVLKLIELGFCHCFLIIGFYLIVKHFDTIVDILINPLYVFRRPALVNLNLLLQLTEILFI